MAVKLLEIMGLEYYLAKSESDKVLAHLSSTNPDSYCVTNDTDVLPHGARNMLMKCNEPSNYEYIRLHDILDSLDMNHTQFIKLCVLCGSDYNRDMRLLEWKTSLSLVKDNYTYKEICKEYDDRADEEEYKHLERVERFFSNTDVEFEKFSGREEINFDAFSEEFEETKTFDERRLNNIKKSLQLIGSYKKAINY